VRSPVFRRDEGAAIDVPFRLLLSVVLISMATAILYPTLQSYQEAEMENRVSLTLAEIEAAAVSVHRHPGSSRTVLIDVPSSGGIRLESLSIGGDLEGTPVEVGTIGWSLSNGVSGNHLVTSSSNVVPMAGPEGGGLHIDSFPCLMVLEAKAGPPGSHFGAFVQVTCA
jgi:hypothetical protein